MAEESINHEVVNNPPEMVDFFNLTQKQRETLQTALLKSRNIIQAWIHTDYNNSANYIRNKTYEKDFASIVENRVSMGLPVIAFIESRRDENYEQTLKRYRERYQSSDNSGIIYYIITAANSDLTPINPRNQQETWDTLAKNLSNIGVKKVILSGEDYLLSYPQNIELLNNEEKNYVKAHPETRNHNSLFSVPTHCVGTVQIRLANRGITTFLSKATSPMTKPRNGNY